MTEQLADNLNLSPEQVAEQEAEENRNHFLESVFKGGDIENASDSARRITVETVLLLHSGELESVPGSSEDRDLAVQQTISQQAGIPKSQAEVTAIVQHPAKKLGRVAGMRKDNVMSAATSTYKTMVGYLHDSLSDIEKLNKVMHSPPDGESVIDLDLLRADRDAQYVLADQLMARDFLDKMSWPAKNTHKFKDSQKYWRGCVLEAAKYAGPSVLGMTVNTARRRAKERLRFWTKNMGEISKSVAGVAVKGALARKEQESEAFVHVEVAEPEVQPEPLTKSDTTKIEVTTFDDFIPDKEIEEIASLGLSYADKSAQIDGYVQDQGMSLAQAEERVLGGRAQRFKGMVIGVEKREDQPSAKALVKHELDAKERRRRRFAKRR